MRVDVLADVAAMVIVSQVIDVIVHDTSSRTLRLSLEFYIRALRGPARSRAVRYRTGEGLEVGVHDVGPNP
jgi:hypothetical protein